MAMGPPDPGTDRALSGRRSLLLGGVSLAVLCAGLFGWGGLASLSGAVVASGRVKAESGEWTVEHIDGGTVSEILVEDGGRVGAGATLLRLDGAPLRSEARILRSELFDLAARRNRLDAEFRDADTIAWDAGFAAMMEAHAEARAAADGHRRLFDARRAARAALRTQLRSRIRHTRQEIAGLEAQAGALARQRGLLEEEFEGQRRLLEKGVTRRPRVLALERALAEADVRRGAVDASTATARARIAELEIELIQTGNRRLEEAGSGLRETQAREAVVRERLAALDLRIGRLAVRAPVAGVVHGLAVSAAGEVLAPGETVAMVVPDDSGFVARVRIEPVHIDQVRAGQDAILRFSAFSARTTPEYTGTVRHVSADVLTDAGGLPWYEAELAIGAPVAPDPGSGPAAWLEDARAALADWRGLPRADAPGTPASPPQPLALAPGMPVDVYLRTDERSPLGYLVRPLTDYLRPALREE